MVGYVYKDLHSVFRMAKNANFHDKTNLQKKTALITNVQMGFGYQQFGKKNDASKKIWRRFVLKSRKSWQLIKLTQKSAFFMTTKLFFLSSKMCIHKVFNIKCGLNGFGLNLGLTL